MSVREYQASQKLEAEAHKLRDLTGANQFYSLLMAAMRVAGSTELDLLKLIFPKTLRELHDRYSAPGGILPGEK